MDILSFIVTIILVTVSGALAPGPLFFATISHGTKSGAKSGFVFSVAHTVVEFSLIMLFYSWTSYRCERTDSKKSYWNRRR